jgi:cytochrome c oxidase subunit II
VWQPFPLFPPEASTFAPREDALFFFLVAVSAVFVVLIFSLVTYFAIRYRRRSPDERPRPTREPIALELTWSLIPFGLMVIMFAWGAQLYFFASRPPAGAMEIAVVAKQWMWKFQHPEGPREIDELHVPVGVPVALTMTSEDVIHSFFVPAFRIKRDVVPGRYVTAWFQATKPGEYRLFCAQYCGTEHAGMTGRVIVMTSVDYQRWLQSRVSATLTPAASGALLFQRLGCSACHAANNTGQGPSLAGIYGRAVPLTNGQSVVADEGYLRKHILTPGKTVVAGYPRIMPTFRGLVNEEQLLQIIAYIKSLRGEERAQAKP